MTTAQRLREEGREERREETMQTLFARVLQLKFGDVPEAIVQRLSAADPEARGRLFDRLVVATSLDELLER